MDIRWSILLACLLAGAAWAEDDDGNIPDAGVDGEDQDDSDESLALDEEESRNLRPRAYTPSAYQQNTLPAGFRPTPSLAELAGYQQRQESEGQQEYVSLVPVRPTQAQQYEQQQHQQQQQQHQQQRQPQRAPHRKIQENRPSRLQQLQEAEEELEDEKEEPDRLTTLLQQSKFDCVQKQTGYYADEELNCEVFHYCQDSVKHSWVCPDGFSFHQVHLICMPPTHENICQKSSKYHFVNEYLYRPINEEEVLKKPSLSLKYSDRYYPSEVYRDDRYEGDDEEEEPPRRQTQAHPAQRPQTAPQVFRTAEEVNIPLGQRRPQRPYDFDF